MFLKKIRDRIKLHKEQNRLAQENWEKSFRNCSFSVRGTINDLIKEINPELTYLIHRK